MPTTAFADDSNTAGITGTAPADITGTGSADDPYLIYTAEGLKTFRDIVNGSNGQTQNTGAHAKLMNDITLNDGTFDADGNYTPGASGKDAEEWTPIGYFNDDSDHSQYAGTFDGDGHTIKGLYVKDVRYAGLFGYAEGATVKNMAVDGYVSTSDVGNYSGGIVGYLSGGSITNCFNYCTVNSESTSGGIVGEIAQSGKITGCGNAGTVSGSGQGTGGIAGWALKNCNIQNCYNIGAVSGDSTYAGGIVGHLQVNSQICNCYNTGSVTQSVGNYSLGGIAGYASNNANIKRCYWLEGTAINAVKHDQESWTEDAQAKTKTDFANGAVLALLTQNDTTKNAWNKCGYLKAAGMIVPLLKGQTADTFPIYTAEDLKTFRDSVNAGNTDISAKLMKDIDLEGSETNRWTPIGTKDAPFTGTFDGNGKKITVLYVDERGNNKSAGLFGHIEIANSDTPVVQNLTVDGTVFAGNEVPEEPVDYYGAGILVGEITVLAGGGVEYGTIKKCHASGKVSSPMKAGGLAGETQYTYFESCTADVEVTETASESRYWGAYSGGFVGRAFQSEFKDCVAYGNVTSVYPSTGGFAGLLYYETTVTHCAAYGKVESGFPNIGGFVGNAENSITIKNSIAMGDVVSNYDEGTAQAGGFAGVASPEWDKAVTFEKCHANGKVTVAEGKVGYGMVGGIGNIRYFKSIGCSYNSEKNPSLDATDEGTWEGIEGKNTAGVLFDVCINYKGGHDMEAVAEVAATCTKDGSTAGSKCKDCGHTEGVTVITAPGHSYSADWSSDEAKHWHQCTKCEAKSDEANHTDATEWIQTSTTHTQKCKSCGAIVVAEENHQWENGVCKTCGYKAPHRPTTQRPEITVIGSGKVTLSTNGRTATITADEGHELASVTLNGKEIATTDNLTGLKTGDKVVVTFREKSDGSAAEIKAVAAKVGKMQLIARSGRTANNNIRITVKPDNKTKNLIKEIKDQGYSVKYKYYRSTKKSSAYTAKLEKNASLNSYINTTGKKGTRYYYKVRLMVYDAKGNLVAKTELKQCKYAARIWNK